MSFHMRSAVFLTVSILISQASLFAQQLPSGGASGEVVFKQFSTYEIIHNLAKQFEIEQDSPLFKRLSSKISSQLANRNPEAARVAIKPDRTIKHFRSDKGILLPTDYSYTAYLPSQEEFLRKFNPNSPEHQAAAITRERSSDALFTPPHLPVCKENRTVVNRHPEDTLVKTKDELLYFDMLILRSSAPQSLSHVATDFSDTFGRGIKVRHYSTEIGDIISLQAARNGVTCLPFRIRITSKTKFIHTGLDALKNYDENLSGPGVLHKVIKDDLKDFM
ncbi:hypothetical protein OAO01_03445 [Oligoflexia bacterium]|nr:hypothetical protein [Oligoflexia bacterium]